MYVIFDGRIKIKARNPPNMTETAALIKTNLFEEINPREDTNPGQVGLYQAAWKQPMKKNEDTNLGQEELYQAVWKQPMKKMKDISSVSEHL